jgi:Concanavalin A-like lectin/glucanases superfamily
MSLDGNVKTGIETSNQTRKQLEERQMNPRSAKNMLKVGLLTVALVGAAIAAHATIISGLEGRWEFTDGYGITAPDSSGLGNTGTLSGAAYFVNDPLRGQVLNVSGITGEMEVPSKPSLTPASGTISVWVKPSQATLADVIHMDTDLLIQCNKSGPFYAYDLRIDSRGSVYAIIANDDPKTCGKQPQVSLKGAGSQVKLNQWTHLAMTWGSGTLAVFANGKQVGATSYTPDATGISYHGAEPLEAAAAIWDFSTGYLEYQGELSDMRVYSRALTSTEISEIANAGI